MPDERSRLIALIQEAAIAAAASAGHTGSVSDELIAERRVEAERDERSH